MIARIARVAIFSAAILAVCGFDRCGEPKSELGWITVSTPKAKYHRTLAVIGDAEKDELCTVSGGEGERAWEVGAIRHGTYHVVGSELRTRMEVGPDGEAVWPMEARVSAYAPRTATVTKRGRTEVSLAPGKGGSIVVRIPAPPGADEEPAGAFVTVSRRPVQVLRDGVASREVHDSGPVTWTMARVGGSVRIDGIAPGIYEVGVEGGGPVKVPYTSARVTVAKGGRAEVVVGK